MLIIFQCCFKEIPRAYRRNLQPYNQRRTSIDAFPATELQISDREKEKIRNLSPNRSGLIVALVIFFIHLSGYSSQETLITPIVTDKTHVSI
jgi:hypothetical protein